MPTLTLKICVLIRCILRETRSPEMNVDLREKCKTQGKALKTIKKTR